MLQYILTRLKNTIEIPLFLLFYAFLVTDPIKGNLIIFRTCYVSLGYNKTECALLGSRNSDNETAELEKLVQPHSAIVGMVNSIIEGLCTSAICLFVGPWSDRFGRKAILILPLIGYLLYFLFMAVFSLIESISPWYALFSTLPICLTGGTPSYLAAVLCYITDSTTTQNRGMKMGIMDAVIFLGIFLGTVSSSYIFTFTNYAIVFCVGTTCCIVAILFTVYLISESLSNTESEGKFSQFFQLSSMNEMVKVTFKRRENHTRYTVLCCCLMSTISIIIINGNGSVSFLYLREQFHWSLQKYTLYGAAASISYVLGTISGVYFLHKILKIPETVLILVSLISALNGALMMGFAKTDWSVYIVPLVMLPAGVFGPMVRSLVSKILPNEELGKIFALLTTSQFLFGIAGSPLYTFIYNATISSNPGFFNFVTAGLQIFNIFIAIGIVAVRTFITKTSYDVLVNENVSSRTDIGEEERS